MRKEILFLLSTQAELPALPKMVLEIESRLSNPDTNNASIASLIKLEPVLSGRLLKIANSAYYAGGKREIIDLTQAITRLGLRMVKEIVYSIELAKLFADNKIINHKEFWRHSVAVAILTRILARKARFSSDEQETAYLGGLMHDIGVMVFASLSPDRYAQFLKKAKAVAEPLHVQEIQDFDIDHAELGSLFVDKWWSVPANVSAAVIGHHYPYLGRSSQRRIDQLVHLANGVCNNLGISNGTGVYAEIFKNQVWTNLGFEAEDIEEILSEAQKSLEIAEELFRQ